jgi:peptide/nickel transport system substrate-binding protein
LPNIKPSQNLKVVALLYFLEESMNKKALYTTLAVGCGTMFAFAAVPNNTLISMVIGDVSTLDPSQVYDTASGEGVENMYETLVTYEGRDLTNVRPLLATSWRATNGGKTYTFTLRKNVKFHSGATMTCEDAEYSFERHLITHDTEAYPYGSNALLNFAYWEDEQKKNVTWAQIDKTVECNSAGQLVLNMPKADPTALAKLSYLALSVIEKKYTVGLGDWSGTERDWKQWISKDMSNSALSQKPNGTGAYRFVSRTANQQVYKAFDGYWGGAPKIDNVIIQKVDELATRVLALNKGDTDITSVVARANLSQVAGQPGVKVLDDLPAGSSNMVFFNQNIKEASELRSGKLDGKGIPANFFSDINVRKAFAHSFDAQTLIATSFLNKGEIRTMAIPSTYLGYDKTLPTYSLDAEKATAFFKRAFGGQVWNNGFEVNFYYNTGNLVRQRIGEIIKTNVEKLNPKFKVNNVGIAFSELLSKADQSRLTMVAGGWVADYPDTDNFIRAFYHSTDGAFKGRLNYVDPQMDKLIDQAKSTATTAARITLYKSIGRRAYDQMPGILVPAAIGFLTYRDNVKGIAENWSPLASGSFGTTWKNLSK